MQVGTILGAIVVLVAAVDVFLTVMHPTRRGPLTFLVIRGVFAAVRVPARLLGRPSLLNPAGPLAMLGVMLAWLVLFWLGYGLIYLENTDQLHYASGVDYGDRGLVEALYFSGMSLTTVGFGDVVGATDALRLLSTVEGASGFAVITAGITFVLSVYPRVSSQRVSARAVQSQATDAAHAARMAHDVSHLVSLQQQVVQTDEDVDRFPVLYFFHSEEADASLGSFLHGAAMVCLMTRWALSPAKVEHARRFGLELHASIGRMLDHHAIRFMPGRGPDRLDRPLALDEARDRLRGLVEAAGDDGDPGILDDEDEVERFAEFVGRCDVVLAHIASQHCREFTPLAAAPRS